MMTAHTRTRSLISDTNDLFGNQLIFNGFRFAEGRWCLWAAAHKPAHSAHNRHLRGAAGGSK